MGQIETKVSCCSQHGFQEMTLVHRSSGSGEFSRCPSSLTSVSHEENALVILQCYFSLLCIGFLILGP